MKNYFILFNITNIRLKEINVTLLMFRNFQQVFNEGKK